MLNLPDVTLFCIYTVAHDLTHMALDDCLKGINFGDVKLFTDQSKYESIEIEPFQSAKDFQQFTNYEVPKYIKTTHFLSFQWDAWVIDPSAWRNSFLDCDYIGAPWWYKEYNVGNSGFSLRSKALADYLSKHRDEYPIRQPEDDTLCRIYRKQLEPQFKWADDLEAYRFAFERTRAPVPSFGFHGIFNWPWVLTAEKLRERLEIASQNSYCTSRPEWQEIIRG